jgi:hypothetical protein
MTTDQTGAAPVHDDQALMDHLRFGTFKQDHLHELVNSVSALRSAGLSKVRIFPRGIPAHDGLQVSGILARDEIDNFFGNVFSKGHGISDIHVFPYGILWPEVFRVDLNVGGPVQVPEQSQGQF